MNLVPKLRTYEPKTLSQLMERFQLTEQDVEKDVRFQHMLKKIVDDENYNASLKTEVGRLKRRVNALLERVLGKKATA